jgi:uncharacterized membrane protein YeaQ/YmgE (transglycosylase-associated protein family)
MQNPYRIGFSITLAIASVNCRIIKHQSSPRRRAAADGVAIAVSNRREPGRNLSGKRGGGDVAPLYKVVRKRNRSWRAFHSRRVRSGGEFMLSLIGQILFGLVIGVIAKLLMPGRDPGGIVLTAVIGMVGALIGTLIGRVLWGGPGYSAGWITSILGAVLLLWAYRAIVARRAPAV